MRRIVRHSHWDDEVLMSIHSPQHPLFGGHFSCPLTTLVVGDCAHETGDTMAGALASLGDVVRTIQIATSHDSTMTRARVVERLRSELTAGRRHPSHVIVSCEAKHARVLIEGLLRLQMHSALRLDGVLFAADGPTVSTRLLTDQRVVPDDGLDALAIADRILVARADLLTTEGLDGVAWALRNGNRLGPISFPALGGVDIGAITDIDAWTGELRVGCSGTKDDDAYATWQVDTPDIDTLVDVVHMLQQVLARCDGLILRLQGVVVTADDESILISGSGATAVAVAASVVDEDSSTLTVVTRIEHAEFVERTLSEVFGVASSIHEPRDKGDL